MVKFFGTPPGVHVGQIFVDRADLRAAGVHPPLMNGIHGTAVEGADSIVLAGGYEEDDDQGDFIIYTGEGGNDSTTKKQYKDQSVDSPGNAGLITSQLLGLPVRVSRSHKAKTPFAPPAGIRYAGLYLVTDHKVVTGSQGFKVILFRLDRLPEQEPYESNAQPTVDPVYATTTVSRRVRDSAMARKVKSLYNHECQICGVTLVTNTGLRYSEGAHVRPLGKPHLGTDVASNLLCLCPNHHTLLDVGGLAISDEYAVSFTPTMAPFAELQFKQWHVMEVSNVQYHRNQWFSAN
jgi:putative restriction endonuclease